jgi:hypothetical protein
MRIVLSTCALLFLATNAAAADSDYLYNARFVQAAPGKLIALIDHCKSTMASYQAAGDEAPLWLRHSQGDKWDLMLLFPMGSYSEYYSADRIARRHASSRNASKAAADLIAWQEDLFVYGPPLNDLRKAWSTAGFFHLEIFQSLAGKQPELYKERQMENAYQRALKRPENFIFIKDRGAPWDLFTVGFYRDLKHYAESAEIPDKDQEAAAKAAGFEASNRIGPYLRTLIAAHHDTLAVAVK